MLELELNGIFLGLNGIDLGCFIFRLHFGIPWDTNGCTDFTDFTDAVRIFFIFCSKPSIGVKKNPYRIREIRKIRTSIRIPRYPKV
jgi:hypothetical protein